MKKETEEIASRYELGLYFDRLEKYCSKDFREALYEAFEMGVHIGTKEQLQKEINEMIEKIKGFKVGK